MSALAPSDLFAGKTAVVTGASAGIGEGFARYAAGLGMKLVLADIAADRLESVAAQLRANGAEVEAVVTDVSDPQSVEAMASQAVGRFGQVDMVINNAGIMAMGFSWEVPAERWDSVLRVNIGGYVNVMRAFIPRMLQQKTQGWFLQVSSIGGMFPSPLMAPYSVTKFGTLALTESLYYELQMQEAPIQVSVVLPDSVKSDIFSSAKEGATLPAAQAFNDALQQRADEMGITAEEHARRVFEQVAEGRYWVTPQPEAIDQGVVPRAEMIRARVNPQLSFEV
ncbi:short-chain dehydrogenase [Glutamicibacter uratoxydans]|uniref:Short-chain dehydrogenase n=1 Tax=Glutamicibacter uratoxydans TaxID=43667 RepID=A0A4Y4DLG5_GLUUR|nr:SDR family NAD(P)-dependent oxidoreductase [Glutamicibacter uratoxydans]GED06162.1 short-chain dehydrogenase [Glutamicibacter uratoxydans]